MKKNKTKEVGSAVMEHSKRAEEFKKLIEKLIDLLESKNPISVHPEAEFLKKYHWKGMITIRFESTGLTKDTAHGATRRKDMVRAFMNDLRKKWKIKDRHLRWFSSTEYGLSGSAHCHILFNFFPLFIRAKQLPDLTDLGEDALESLKWICEQQDIPQGSTDLHWSPVTSSDGLVDYALKIESGRKLLEKEIIWSVGCKTWAAEMEKFLMDEVMKEFTASPEYLNIKEVES